MNQDEPVRNKVPNPEVWPRAQRRRFSAEYKLRILEEAGASSGSGQIGALLRREGLYSSHLTTWRRQRAQGQLDGLSPKTRGRKPSVDEGLVKELAALERENERLAFRLQQTETIIDVQKKLSELLGLAANEKETGEPI
ncbi:MAG: transposase [Ardenticatenia bacterium]|nr:transposase [Ardenticatenia bacterium]